MKARFDIFPHEDLGTGKAYHDLSPIDLSEKIARYGTTNVEVDDSHKDMVLYYHFRAVLLVVNGQLVINRALRNPSR